MNYKNKILPCLLIFSLWCYPCVESAQDARKHNYIKIQNEKIIAQTFVPKGHTVSVTLTNEKDDHTQELAGIRIPSDLPADGLLANINCSIGSNTQTQKIEVSGNLDFINMSEYLWLEGNLGNSTTLHLSPELNPSDLTWMVKKEAVDALNRKDNYNQELVIASLVHKNNTKDPIISIRLLLMQNELLSKLDRPLKHLSTLSWQRL